MSAASVLKRDIANDIVRPLVYTYPPRSAYVPQQDLRSVLDIWRQDHLYSGRELNLYFHIPFCPYRCTFCNLYTVTGTSSEDVTSYARALAKQLKDASEIIQSRRLRTINFGGGTPTTLSVHDFRLVFAALDEVCPSWRLTVEEVSVEATPDSIAPTERRAYLTELFHLGVDRINIGVQSLMPAELRRAGRGRANQDRVEAAFEAMRSAGIPNLSTDLIIGLPEQTDESWQATVKALTRIRPDTVSTYFLTVRPNSGLVRADRAPPVNHQVWYGRYDLAREAFHRAGYEHETNVRYRLRPHGGLRQKVLQFQGVPTLGIGAGARSYNNTFDYIIGGDARATVSQVRAYVDDAMTSALQPEGGFLFNDEERYRKRLALAPNELDLARHENGGAQMHQALIEPVVETAIASGLLTPIGTNRLEVTAKGTRHRDALARAFFSANVLQREAAFYNSISRQPSRPNTSPYQRYVAFA